MRRSHPLSDQLPWEHTGQGLPYLGFPVSAMNLFRMHIFHQSPSFTRYSFYQPNEGWKVESTCQHWGLNSPPFAQESDALLTELSWPAVSTCITVSLKPSSTEHIQTCPVVNHNLSTRCLSMRE